MMIVLESYRYKKEGKIVIAKTEEDFKGLKEAGKIMGTIRDEMVKNKAWYYDERT